MSDSESFLLRWRGRVSGPFPLETILQKLDENEIGVWHEIQHQGAWLTVEEFLALRDKETREEQVKATRLEHEAAQRSHENATPPAFAGRPVPVEGEAGVQPLYRPKSMKLFCFLGLTFGFVGAHNFYAGYWGTAIAQLLLTVVTIWLGFGIIAAWLWAMIELLLVHTDRRGVRMA